MKAGKKGRLPRFGAPSRQLKDALGVLASEPLVRALQTRADPKQAFVPSKRYQAAEQLVNEESSKRLTVLSSTLDSMQTRRTLDFRSHFSWLAS